METMCVCVSDQLTRSVPETALDICSCVVHFPRRVRPCRHQIALDYVVKNVFVLFLNSNQVRAHERYDRAKHGTYDHEESERGECA